MPDNEREGPLAGNWADSCYYSNNEVKEIDEAELMLLVGGILDLFLPKTAPKSDIAPINEVLAPERHHFAKLALEKRESEFYASNKMSAKQQLSLASFIKTASRPLRSSSKTA